MLTAVDGCRMSRNFSDNSVSYASDDPRIPGYALLWRCIDGWCQHPNSRPAIVLSKFKTRTVSIYPYVKNNCNRIFSLLLFFLYHLFFFFFFFFASSSFLFIQYAMLYIQDRLIKTTECLKHTVFVSSRYTGERGEATHPVRFRTKRKRILPSPYSASRDEQMKTS